MPRDSVPDVLPFAQLPAPLSYRPIRAQIQAGLDTDDEELVTDICLLVTVIANGRQQVWLTQIAGTDARSEREALDQLKHVQQLWGEEIAAVRHLSDHLAGLCRQAGLTPSRIDALIDAKVRKEFFHFP